MSGYHGGFISVSMARRLLCSFTLRVGVNVSARYREALSLHYSDVQVETMSDFTGVKDTFLWDFTCPPWSGFVGAM